MFLYDDTQPLTLSMLNGIVRETIESVMPDSYWVQAELASVRENRGHCYMELIEKVGDGVIAAQARACCWKNTWLHTGRHFSEVTGSPLSSGMKVLMRVHASFHEAFGFSWIVDEIDPTFTLGDMARRRQEIIRILTEEGVIDLNKQLPISPFCQRIAVISSATAAGYGDFCNQLADNPYGFKFETQLFPAIMQGEGVEQSIINALERIYDTDFDCVVIIRGGGAAADLSGFDTLALAENVTNFPIPIITGIGHDRDESILDMVSHTRVKTPTAAAAFLIDHLKEVHDAINDSQERITRYVQQTLTALKAQLTTISEVMPRIFPVIKAQHESKLNTIEQKLPFLISQHITNEQHRLLLFAEKLKALDPTLLLKRGYSITLHNGHIVKDATTLHEGDEIETRLAKGTVVSKVKK